MGWGGGGGSALGCLICDYFEGGGGGARNWNALSVISFYLEGVWEVGGRGLCFGMPNLWIFFSTS